MNDLHLTCYGRDAAPLAASAQRASAIAALLLLLLCQPLWADAAEGIAEAPGPAGLRLKDYQLDAVAAGLAAKASGAAQAEGDNAATKADVFTTVGQPGPQNALSIGQAAASASGSIITGPATATSTLTLTVTVP
ncbi:MAG: hypothetical protein AB7H71_12845 [Alphaproteobacteria bacterium]